MNRKSQQERTDPWNVPIDITQPGADKKIKRLGKESRRLGKNEKIKELLAEIIYLILK